MKLQTHEEELIPPKEELDEEDTEALVSDCYVVLLDVAERRLPARLASDIAKLLVRLEETLSWHRLH